MDVLELAQGRIVARQEDAIGWLVINQPDKRNAVSAEMWRAIPKAVEQLVQAPGIRLIVVRGAGAEAFASGADISEFDTVRKNSASNAEFTRDVQAATGSLANSSFPVIAMIQGWCIGGGMVIASACDIRIASDDAKFGVPAGRLGLGYELQNMGRLVALVGPAAAMDLVFTARRMDAIEALRLGFLSQVVAKTELEKTLRDYSSAISANAPLSLRAAKMAARYAISDGQDLATAQAAIDQCFNSADFKEGRHAFVQKRAPNFRGL